MKEITFSSDSKIKVSEVSDQPVRGFTIKEPIYMEELDPIAEIQRLHKIIKDCLAAMPCGNMVTHTPENLASRIAELAESLAMTLVENEKMREVLEVAREAIEEVHNAYCATSTECCGRTQADDWAELALSKIKEIL